jgi:hypothetical protein
LVCIIFADSGLVLGTSRVYTVFGTTSLDVFGTSLVSGRRFAGPSIALIGRPWARAGTSLALGGGRFAPIETSQTVFGTTSLYVFGTTSLNVSGTFLVSGWRFAGPSVALLGLALRLPSPGSSASGWRCAGPRGCSLCSHRELFSGQPHLMFSGHPWSRAGASLALRSPYSGWRCACPRRPPWARPRAGASLALGGARFARTETRLRSTLSL